VALQERTLVEPAGANEFATIFHTLVETVKLHGVDPSQHFLEAVRVPSLAGGHPLPR
jgi:hypothetical protein